MELNRRQLLHRSALAAGVLCLPAIAIEPAKPSAQSTSPAGDDPFSRMTWFNQPASSKINGSELTVLSKPYRNS